ncbi:MAG: 4-hydroxy-tetrahydrodipicolinate synthase [Ruminococcaceae bacterium]|nr:4-hydroxy-tetrahydrodipicolinate synthase [Oscillospiraceae bacterium]
MKNKIFTGAGVAIVTPFKEKDGNPTGAVDYDRLGELIEMQITGGTDAIIICGTTGEASTMPDEEHLAVIKYAIDKTAKRIPVIAGTGSNDTHHAVKLSMEAERLGADAILSVTPYYNKTTQKGLVAHFEAIANSISIPVILYNVPGRTGVNIEPATYEKLCKIPNINAVKECNLAQMPETVKRCGDELYIYTGEDGQVFYPTAAGGLGVISVLSNVAPKYMHDLVWTIKNGNIEEGWKMQLGCLDLVKAMFCEVNPIPVKEALNILGYNVGGCRLPLVAMTDEHKAYLTDTLAAFGFDVKR